MNPGDRVTIKYDRRTFYGTVIPEQFKDNEEIVFVVWDREPDYFKAYRCGEVRLVRDGEEEKYPEGCIITEEDFVNAAKEALSKIYIDENGNLNASLLIQ
jgi:hypothetical protein